MSPSLKPHVFIGLVLMMGIEYNMDSNFDSVLKRTIRKRPSTETYIIATIRSRNIVIDSIVWSGDHACPKGSERMVSIG